MSKIVIFDVLLLSYMVHMSIVFIPINFSHLYSEYIKIASILSSISINISAL
jgi:hypothetical protein